LSGVNAIFLSLPFTDNPRRHNHRVAEQSMSLTKSSHYAIVGAACALAAGLALVLQKDRLSARDYHPVACPSGHRGLTLPPGFCATVFADHLGHARHLIVAADGTVYVNSWDSGDYYPHSPAPNAGFIIGLKDRDGNGVADVIERFGLTPSQTGKGGTGIALWHGALFAEENGTVVRYPLVPGKISPSGSAEMILSGLPLSGDHPMHPFTIETDGTLLVKSGSATNTCEHPNRQPGAKGTNPCVEQRTRGGIWAYRADRQGQIFSPAERWATGIRNTGGLALDAAGRLFAVQHGRDQLSQNWRALYTDEQGAELPAEILFSPFKGADFGWPTCYFDGGQRRQVLAPEYGGDGGHSQGDCAGKAMPLAAYPAHWAPNDVTIYTAHSFPAAFAEGAFIAFHGSWNRAPAPQDGYLVAFQPMKNGRPVGKWIRFADGFAGAFREPARAVHRPAGLAVAPDGALYIADDVRGTIWRVTYHGPPDAAPTDAPRAAVSADNSAQLAPPPGSSAAEVALGQRIYLGTAKGGTCSGCHGSNGRGSSAGGSLVGPQYLWSDGSVDGLATTIKKGVSHPKKSSGGMPALGGADLNERDVRAVAAYVWTLGHKGR
jgi:glucose/arabinose dehydrogenase/mono/diheme cytochrome c family protein